MMRTFGSSEIAIEIVADIAFHQARISPMIRKPHLMDDLSVDRQHLHSGRDQGMSFDGSARSHNGHPFARSDRKLLRQLGRNLAEQFRLEFSQVRQSSRHASGRVMFRQPIRRQDERKTTVGRSGIFVSDAGSSVRHWIRLPLRIHRIADRRFERLVVRRQRAVFQTRRNPNPAETIGMKNKRLVAGERIVAFRAFGRLIIGWLGRDKIRHIVARPFLGLFIPPN